MKHPLLRVALLVAFAAVPVFAADGAKGKSKDVKAADAPAADGAKNYKSLRIGPDGLPLPADRKNVESAKRNLAEAKARLTTALSGTSVPSMATIEGSLWQDPDYRQAALDLRVAQSDYDAVRQPIFDALKQDQFYKDLERQQRESQAVLSHLVFMGRGTFDWLLPHATTAFSARQRMTREEILAMEQAPEVDDARKRMLRAAAKVRQIRDARVGQAASPAAIAAARAELAEARADVKDAQSRYAAALARDAEYEQLRQAYLEEYRRTGKPPEIADSK